MATWSGPSRFDIETQAIADLVTRMRQMRRRVVLPFLVTGIIIGNAGIAAHAMGYWSVIGTLPDNTYFINWLTVALAFFLSVSPLLATGIPMYLLQRARTRRLWSQEYLGRGVSDEWLSNTQNRFP